MSKRIIDVYGLTTLDNTKNEFLIYIQIANP